MKTLLSFILLALKVSATAQVSPCGLPCKPNDILDVGLHVQGCKLINEPLPYCEVSKDSIQKGFTLQLRDTSYGIKSFVIVQSNNQRTQQHCISGYEVNSNNNDFLKSIQAGETLAIECVSIERSDSFAISTSLYIMVIN